LPGVVRGADNSTLGKRKVIKSEEAKLGRPAGLPYDEMATTLAEASEEAQGPHRTVEPMMIIGCCVDYSMTTSLNNPQKWIKSLRKITLPNLNFNDRHVWYVPSAPPQGLLKLKRWTAGCSYSFWERSFLVPTVKLCSM
jgi:hypothetical protein